MWSEVSLLSHFKAVFEVENSKDLIVGCYYYKNEWNIRLTRLVETSVHRLGGDSSVHRVAGVFFLLQNVCKLKLFCCDINTCGEQFGNIIKICKSSHTFWTISLPRIYSRSIIRNADKRMNMDVSYTL